MRYEKSEYMEIPIILYIILFFTIAVGTHMERKFGGDVQDGYFVTYRYFAVLFPYVICVMALFLTGAPVIGSGPSPSSPARVC